VGPPDRAAADPEQTRTVTAPQSTSGTSAQPRKRARSREHDRIVQQSLRRLVDKLRRGILLIDTDRRVRYANPAARRIVEHTPDVLRVHGGRLELGTAVARDRLERYLVEGRNHAAAGPKALALRIDRADGSASYRTLISRLEHDDCAGESRTLVSVIVYEPQVVRRIPNVVLNELYGLTRAEAVLVGELYAGRALNDAARAIGISPNTARTHLKRIFDKTQVRSQAELLQLLALGPKIV
jgi:DNA-binding CsgD family transcriptional regulator